MAPSLPGVRGGSAGVMSNESKSFVAEDMLVIGMKDIYDEPMFSTITLTHRCPMLGWQHHGYSTPRPTLVIGANPYIIRHGPWENAACTWCGAVVTAELQEFLDTSDKIMLFGECTYRWQLPTLACETDKEKV